MTRYKAFRVERDDNKNYSRSVVELDEADLPEGEVLIDVKFSSLNYKDALSATGNPGVTRKFPHTPGIDAAGVVVESASTDFVLKSSFACASSAPSIIFSSSFPSNLRFFSLELLGCCFNFFFRK